MNIIIPKVTDEFEKLEFNENYDGTKDKSTFTLKDGTYVEFEKQSYGFVEQRFIPNTFFIVVKQFYINRNIKAKGVMFNSGYFKIGFWYFFNEQGKLTDKEDHDKGYKFTFEELYFLLEKKKIDLTLGYIEMYSGIHTKIMKDVESNKPVWIVKWLKEPLLLEEIYIDGKSGKVIKTEHIKRKES